MVKDPPKNISISWSEFIPSDELYKSGKLNLTVSGLSITAASKLKTKNLGLKGAKIYEREIQYFFKKEKKFTTIKDYCKNLDI